MTGTTFQILSLSIGFSLSIIALISVLAFSKSKNTHFNLSNTEKLNPKIVKVTNVIGGDLLSLVPKQVQRQSVKSKEIEDLFKTSGNPWGVNKLEFLVLRITYAFLSGIFGLLFLMIVKPSIMLSTLILLSLIYLGWNRPLSAYKSISKGREKDFKKHFPEMLDYLTMVMSDGTYTFSNAIEIVIKYLPDSAVRQEFQKVIDSVNTGMTTDQALNDLSQRVPSTSLEAFVIAVNNANALNTPMEGLMRTRAKKSREDLLNELELIIQGLPTKTMLTVGPPAILSMLIIFMVPVVIALMQSL